MSETPTAAGFRSGFAAFVGKPNAGKSTLLNALVGEQVAAVSAKPQTTRTRLAGILTDDTSQVVLVDLPGAVDPNDPLNTALSDNISYGLDGVDLIVHLVDVADHEPMNEAVRRALAASPAPRLLVLTKLDGKNERVDAGCQAGELPGIERSAYARVLGVSAKSGAGLPGLMAEVRSRMPEGPMLYDPEMFVDAQLRDLAAEAIREKAFLFLQQELPYAVAVKIDDFEENEPPRKWVIRATVYVERDSQKGILIGDGGGTLKKLSTAARQSIERICQAPVFLELWVKVRKNWRKNERDLLDFGIKQPRKKRKR
ncbi:MAG: GTPase Era [Candidatus Sumerlaeia bacterium]|nr:GTPase Era [Candidatus Sumerlaeia bacterium]